MYESSGNIQDAEGFRKAAETIRHLADRLEVQTAKVDTFEAVMRMVNHQHDDLPRRTQDLNVPRDLAAKLIYRADIIEADWKKAKAEAIRKTNLGSDPVGPSDRAEVQAAEAKIPDPIVPEIKPVEVSEAAASGRQFHEGANIRRDGHEPSLSERAAAAAFDRSQGRVPPQPIGGIIPDEIPLNHII